MAIPRSANLLKSIFLLIFSFLFFGCEKLDFNTTDSGGNQDTGQSQNDKVLLKIYPGLSTSTTLVYLYDSQDDCFLQKFLEEGDTLSLKLKKGTYKVLALNDYSAYAVNAPYGQFSIPYDYTFEQVLIAPSTEYPRPKLSIRSISLQADTEIPVCPTDVMARINFNYKDFPYSPYVLLDGIHIDYSTVDDCTFPKTTKAIVEGNSTYAFATEAPTTLIVDDKEFPLPRKFQKGKTYDVTLTYSMDGNHLLQMEDYDYDEMPEMPCIFENHVGILVSNTSMLCMSLEEWSDLNSDVSLADEYANTYTEGNLSGWRQPTREEAQIIKEFYGNPLEFSHLNNLFLSLGGKGISTDSRYLCESSTYSYTFSNSGLVSKVGSKKSDYRLRLVKEIPIRLRHF